MLLNLIHMHQYTPIHCHVRSIVFKSTNKRINTHGLIWYLVLQDNLFEWHFTIRGPSDTDFSGGIYHGRIVLPPEYPMKPPSIILLTVSLSSFPLTLLYGFLNHLEKYYIFKIRIEWSRVTADTKEIILSIKMLFHFLTL